jgi:diacylglycerol kinase (ATP)
MNRLLRLINPLLLLRAFKDATSGLGNALKTERAVQQEVVLIIVGIGAALFLTDVALERAVLIGVLGIVLVIELVNSAIEATIDRIGPELHPLSKQAKDLGSAAVLTSLVTAVVVWLIILV